MHNTLTKYYLICGVMIRVGYTGVLELCFPAGSYFST